MKIFLLCVFIFLLIALIIILPFKIRMCFHINYFNMEMYYLVRFLFINIICGKTAITNNGIVVENKSNHLIKNDEKGEYSIILISEYLKRIKVSNINFYKNFGSGDNAMNTAVICAFDKLIFDSISKFLKTKNQELNAYNYINPEFCEELNMTSIYGVIKISILDVILSLISSKLKSKK